LEPGVERSEGIFEEGGKKEYVKYDGTDQKYPHESSDNSREIAEVVNAIKNILDKKGLSAKKLLADDKSRKIEEYGEIARALGIRGYRNQDDVYGFIDFIVRNLANK